MFTGTNDGTLGHGMHILAKRVGAGFAYFGPEVRNELQFCLFVLFRRTSSQRTLTSKTNLEETIMQPRVP